MSIQFMEKWDQYSLIAELTLKLKDVSPQFGKTVLQKLVYILQEIYKVPCGYNYILYNYGPYSAGLADDLNFFATMEGVKIEWGGGLGYEIKEADRTEYFREKGEDFLEKYAPEIDKVIKRFGRMHAKELELQSTIMYALKKESLNKGKLVQFVKEIKPYFTHSQIESSYQKLEPLLCNKGDKR
ncbi:MAG: hypothetical protein ACOX0L_10385 [Natronincolaceae bacterium]